jgi:hypothetical protein
MATARGLLFALLVVAAAHSFAALPHGPQPFNPGGKTVATAYCTASSSETNSSGPSIRAPVCRLQVGTLDAAHGMSWGTFDDTINSTGWGVLNIQTAHVAAADAGLAYYAAGLVEGAITAPRMVDAFHNMLSDGNCCKDSKFAAFVEEQRSWTDSMVAAHPNDPFWSTVGALGLQQDGLSAGYTQSASALQLRPLSRFDITTLSYNADVGGVMASLHPSLEPAWFKLSHQELKEARRKRGFERCSALVKLTPDMSELFMAQATWMIFGFMNRIYKIYGIDVEGHRAKHVSFSSYPGVLASLDDFYAMDSGLGMVQTSNPVYLPTYLPTYSGGSYAP